MSKTALIVADIQNGIIDMIAQGDTKEPYLERVSKAISAARKAGIPVIYVRVGFHPGYPDAHDDNIMMSRVKAHGGLLLGTPATEIHAAVAPAEGEVTVTKHRVNAFIGTDLEVILRSQNVRKLVLAGISTSGVILSSLRYAADYDYAVTVLADLCMDRDEEVHRVLLEKVFPAQATVMQSEDWMAKL